MQLQYTSGAGGSGGAGSSLASAPNGALDGHKLLYLTSKMLLPSEEWFKKIKAAHPGLEIVIEEQDTFRNQTVNENLDWANITILLTGAVLPTPEQAPKLQLVQLHSAGANHVLNKPIFTDTKVKFCTANGVHGPQIAEWVVCTFLALNHRIPKYLENQRKQKWEWDWDSLDLSPEGGGVDDCVSKRVGILGYGSIGRQVARVAKAMGMDVVAYTNHPRPTPESRRDTGYIVPGTGDPDGSLPSAWYSGTDASSIDEFLGADLDLLVIAVPLTPLTHGLIGEAQFKIMAKRRTFLSNIARGPIVNTDALMQALDEGLIRGAALDVTDPEPLPDGHPLFSKKNLIITPHVSASTRSYGSRTADILELNLDKFSKGEKLINLVNRKDGY